MLQFAFTLMEQTSDSGPLSTGPSQTHPPQPGPPAFGGAARTPLWSETASLLLLCVVTAMFFRPVVALALFIDQL
jgi:hypothetical protein